MYKLPHFRPGLWASLLTGIAFITLIGLGAWQVQRLQWKEGLLREISVRSEAPAIQLPNEIGDPEKWRYQRVRVSGHFQHEKEIHVHAGRGYHIITPLLREGDAAPVLVVRGFVPEEKRVAEKRKEGLVSDRVTVVGIARLSQQPNAFTPENNPAENIWYWRDLPRMAEHAGVPRAVPLFIEAFGDAPGGWPQGDVTQLQIPNNHLQYAITWFSLAVVLLVIFGVFGLRRAKEAGAVVPNAHEDN